MDTSFILKCIKVSKLRTFALYLIGSLVKNILQMTWNFLRHRFGAWSERARRRLKRKTWRSWWWPCKLSSLGVSTSFLKKNGKKVRINAFFLRNYVFDFSELLSRPVKPLFASEVQGFQLFMFVSWLAHPVCFRKDGRFPSRIRKAL